MNILILSLAYAPYSGVGSARMTSLSQYLVKHKNKVTVVCYDSSVFGDTEQREIPEGVERIPVEKKAGKRENIKNLERTVEEVIQKGHFHVCISSVGPFETMFFIDKVWRKWKIPYIIDYRDPWLLEKNTFRPKGIVRYKQFAYRCLCLPIEKRAIKNAEKIVLVTDRNKEDIIERYHVGKAKCRVIYNGYEDVPDKCQVEKEDDFVIGIAGKFASYNSEAAEIFLSVCEEINYSYPLKVMHIGNKDALSEEKYSRVYFNVGIKNHKDTMKTLAQSNALLICYAHQNGLGTKVFDYIALNKPIIYIGVVPSELTAFINRFEHVYICQNREQMSSAVEKLIQECPAFLTSEYVGKYSRERQNEIYWKLIQEVGNLS